MDVAGRRRPQPRVFAVHAGKEVTLLGRGNVQIEDPVRAQAGREGGEQPGWIVDVLEHVDVVDDVERTDDREGAKVAHAAGDVWLRGWRAPVREIDRHEAPAGQPPREQTCEVRALTTSGVEGASGRGEEHRTERPLQIQAFHDRAGVQSARPALHHVPLHASVETTQQGGQRAPSSGSRPTTRPPSTRRRYRGRPRTGRSSSGWAGEGVASYVTSRRTQPCVQGGPAPPKARPR